MLSRQSSVVEADASVGSRFTASRGAARAAEMKQPITTDLMIRGEWLAGLACRVRALAGASAGISLLMALLAQAALARGGGGHAFSGGSFGGGGYHGGGGSGGGGGGALIWLLLNLVLRVPIIGVPLFIIVVLFFLYTAYKRWQSSDDGIRGMESSPADLSAYAPAAAAGPGMMPGGTYGQPSQLTARQGFEHLRQFDPNFSEIAFTDFLYALYARSHEARGKGTLSDLSSYLSPEAIYVMIPGHPDITAVGGVIVGSTSIRSVTDAAVSENVAVRVRFETNYTETEPTGRQNSYYVIDEWVLTRKRDVQSPEPEKLAALHCPKCGGALDKKPDGSCAYCGVKITGGDFNWYVTEVMPLERESQGPLLTRDVPETGTELPTVYQPDMNAQHQRFMQENPSFMWPHAEERFRHIFMEIQNAWSSLKWEKARPYESDNIFQTHRYWIEAYQKQGLRNALDNVNIESVTPVRIETDAFYDAITTRIFADMLDYTVDTNGKVVCGSRTRARRFSEYWTFMRHRGAQESAHSVENCPNCGAPLKVNMAGSCEFCGGKITTGSFDWVLSRIEQDESYTG